MGGIQSNKIQFELLSLLICSNFIYSPHILLSSLAFISDEMFAERIYNVPSIVRFYRLQLKDGEKHFERSDGEIFTSFYSAPHLVRLYFSFEWLFTLSITVPFNRSNKKNSLEILVWHNFSIHCYIAKLHISFATLFIENRFSIIRFSRSYFIWVVVLARHGIYLLKTHKMETIVEECEKIVWIWNFVVMDVGSVGLMGFLVKHISCHVLSSRFKWFARFFFLCRLQLEFSMEMMAVIKLLRAFFHQPSIQFSFRN